MDENVSKVTKRRGRPRTNSLGRPKLGEDVEKAVRILYASGEITVSAIADVCHISISSVYRLLDGKE